MPFYVFQLKILGKQQIKHKRLARCMSGLIINPSIAQHQFFVERKANVWRDAAKNNDESNRLGSGEKCNNTKLPAIINLTANST